MFDRVAFHETLNNSSRKLLSSRVQKGGYWEGELSSSPLATATAVLSLFLFVREGKGRIDARLIQNCKQLISKGVTWLVDAQNSDGGFGDTVQSPSNLSTTTLVWAALTTSNQSPSKTVSDSEAWLINTAGSLQPQALASAISRRYGNDRTFSAPILTVCTLAGRFEKGAKGWSQVPQLPFELAAFPHQWFKRLRLSVVSYALPALIAIGQVRHYFRPTWNPILRLVRVLIRRRTLRVLEAIQPENGGYLEAVPLTSFVVMSLVVTSQFKHPVVSRCVSFLIGSARKDGSWPIDTNLATWLTTLSVRSLSTSKRLTQLLTSQDRQNLRHWLMQQQFNRQHPYTHAQPGGWAWTDRPGGVPDADDTSGALLALQNLGPIDRDVVKAATAGITWLLTLQNSDGGIPTFCRGWGQLPFDRSTPDLTAHALLAWSSWYHHLPPEFQDPLQQAIKRAVRYLATSQREDGSWVPLWFGNQLAPRNENLTYGTARVLLGLNSLRRYKLIELPDLRKQGINWLLATQNENGGWGGAKNVASSIEETALAVQALADSIVESPLLSSVEIDKNAIRTTISKGITWLIEKTDKGQHFEPAPIGLYFSKLWYCEKHYPVIFAVAALGRSESVV